MRTILTFKQQSIFQEKLPENLVSKEESYSKHKFRPNKSSKLGQMWYQNDVPVIAGRHCSQTIGLMA